MAYDGIKRAGHCTLCGIETHEVLQTWKRPGIEGFPRKIGAPHENARLVAIRLSDGSFIEITICAECLPQLPARMARLRSIVWDSQMFHFDKRNSFGARPLRKEQRDKIRADVAKTARAAFLGIIGVRKPKQDSGVIV